MAKEFNVPSVVFPPNGNPSSTMQQRRLPTAPSNPLAPQTPASSSCPLTSDLLPPPPPSPPLSSPAVPPPESDSMTSSPLLEELGINTRQIWRETASIMNPFWVNPNLHEDADLSGPFIFLMAFGLFQLLAGKLHFGIILGWVTVTMLFLYVVFNMLAGA